MFQRVLDFIFPPRNEEKLLRACTLEMVRALNEPIHVDSTTPATLALLPFRVSLVRALIHECKYHRSALAISFLTAILRDFLEAHHEEQGELSDAQYVFVPIPLSTTRRRTRGYNQIELILKRVSADMDIPLISAIRKVRDTNTQTALARHERLKNQRDAFEARGVDSSLTYILVDDVITTGATMQAAIDALRQGGARHIIPIALAH